MLRTRKKVFFYLKISVRQKDSKKHFLGDLSNKLSTRISILLKSKRSKINLLLLDLPTLRLKTQRQPKKGSM
jgi:hypothetical protein